MGIGNRIKSSVQKLTNTTYNKFQQYKPYFGIGVFYGSYIIVNGVMMNLITKSLINEEIKLFNILGYGVLFYMIKDELPAFLSDITESVRR